MACIAFKNFINSVKSIKNEVVILSIEACYNEVNRLSATLTINKKMLSIEKDTSEDHNYHAQRLFFHHHRLLTLRPRLSSRRERLISWVSRFMRSHSCSATTW